MNSPRGTNGSHSSVGSRPQLGASVSTNADSSAEVPLPPSGLTVDDFQRLGVRPHECRLSVIRRATARRAKVLADRQLVAPSQKTEQQLSQIATSAYRLMDPRRREEPQQRVYIGRIMPNVMVWAGRTRFAVGNDSDAASPETETGQLPTLEMSDDEAPFIDLDDAIPPLATGIDLGSSLTRRLDSEDLLSRGPLQRKWILFRSQLRHPPIAILSVGASLLIAVALLHGLTGILTTSNRQIASSRVAVDPAPTLPDSVAIDPVPVATLPVAPGQTALDQTATAQVDRASTTNMKSAVNVEDPNNPATELSHTELTPTPAAVTNMANEELLNTVETPANSPDLLVKGVEPNDALSTTDLDAMKPLVKTSDSVPNEPAPAVASKSPPQDPSSTEAPDLDRTPDSSLAGTDLMIEITSAEMMDVEPSDVAAKIPDYLADPFADLDLPSMLPDFEFAGPTAVAPPAAVPTAAVPPAAVPTAAVPAAVVPASTHDDKFHVAPDAALASKLKDKLIDLIPDLASAVTPDSVSAIIDQIADVETSLELGSPDYWMARRTIAELTWLTAGEREVKTVLQPLLNNYDATLPELLSSTFVNAPKFLETSETHNHRFQQGVRLYDRLLIMAAYPQAAQVSKSLNRSIQFLDEVEPQQLLNTFDNAAQQMTRSQVTAEQVMLSPIDSASVSEAGITGRYLCLSLRQWEQGLPWLAKSSDARLVTLAEQELALSGDSTVDQRVELAERWIAAAERSEGRSADSIRLHAIDLMNIGLTSASGLQKLELERAINDAKVALPFYLTDEKSPAIREAPLTDGTIRQDPFTKDPVTQEAVNTAATQALATDPKLEQRTAMSGRMRIDGKDAGVQLSYGPPMAITDKVFDQIRGKLNRKFDRVTIELIGEFDLAEDANLRIRYAKSFDAAGFDAAGFDVMNSDKTVQRLAVDGRKIELTDTAIADVELTAGKHTIEWTLTATSFPGLFLDVRNAETNEPIELREAYKPKRNDLHNVLQVDMLPSKPQPSLDDESEQPSRDES